VNHGLRATEGATVRDAGEDRRMSLMKPRHTRWLGAAIAAAALSACRTAPAPRPAPESPPPASGPVVPTVGPSSASAIATARADSVRRPYAEADIEFMTGMIGHHAQAIAMARMVPSHGSTAAIRTLAARIINAQRDDIALMQHWLADRGQPVPDALPTGMRMKMGGMEHDMLMPGMLTPAQMQALDRARGEEFDRLFLQFMIQHHSGAVTMVRSLFGTDGAGQDERIFKFASDVNVDQSTEIERMRTMLAALLIQRPAP
jgi:uncharacterized protein (DUF305 family)